MIGKCEDGCGRSDLQIAVREGFVLLCDDCWRSDNGATRPLTYGERQAFLRGEPMSVTVLRTRFGYRVEVNTNQAS